MKYREPFGFWNLQPDGARAFVAYEHIDAYYEGCRTQYARIYDLWHRSSAIDSSGDAKDTFTLKRRNMQQVVRDVHYLLISVQVIWKTLQRMCDASLYPNFTPLALLRDKWAPYFEQYRDPRNTLEHFDDQIIGPDTRSNSPGCGLHLRPDGGFSLGSQNSVLVNENTFNELESFRADFEACLDSIVGKSA